VHGFDASKIDMYERWFQAEESSRTTQCWIAGILVAPFAWAAVVETGAVSYIGQGLNWVGRSTVNSFRASLLDRVSNTGGDLVAQLSTNGGSIGDLNLTSLVASFGLPNAPFLNAVVGSAGEFSVNNGFDNSVIAGNKTTSKFLFESIIGGFFGKVGNGVSDLKGFQKVYGSFGSKFIPDYLGNSIPSVGGLIYDAGNK
jgi:hypothetical protein